MAENKFVKAKGTGNNFIKIKCKDCENVQVTYSKGSSTVVCNICGATLVLPTGGTISTNAEVLEVLQ